MTDDLCLDVAGHRGPAKMIKCHGLGGNQKWEYDSQVRGIKHHNKWKLGAHPNRVTSQQMDFFITMI